jgi:hypothetical protein
MALKVEGPESAQPCRSREFPRRSPHHPIADLRGRARGPPKALTGPKALRSHRGTTSSNPLRSSGESTNFRFLTDRWSPSGLQPLAPNLTGCSKPSAHPPSARWMSHGHGFQSACTNRQAVSRAGEPYSESAARSQAPLQRIPASRVASPTGRATSMGPQTPDQAGGPCLRAAGHG